MLASIRSSSSRARPEITRSWGFSFSGIWAMAQKLDIFENSHLALGFGQAGAGAVERFVFFRESRTHCRMRGGGVPAIDGQKAPRIIGVAQERGAQKAGAAAKQRGPIAGGGIRFLEIGNAVGAHDKFPDDLEQGPLRIETKNPNNEIRKNNSTSFEMR